jgi:hypothetical protein
MTATAAQVAPRRAAQRSHLAEIRRLRAQLAAALAAYDQLAALARELADAIDPAAELRLRRALVAEHRAAALEDGARSGYLLAVADIKAAQHGIVRDAELEMLRYGPGGRKHFGDPRPGDFPGRGEVTR